MNTNRVILMGLGLCLIASGAFASGGLFKSPPDNYLTGAYPYSVCVGDFDNDGKPDLAVANWGSDNVTILKNIGNGVFEVACNPIVGTGPMSVCAQDFDKDGRLDLAVANCDPWNQNPPYTVSILKNRGNWLFEVVESPEVGSEPHCISTGDFNKDGKPDLAVANYGATYISILLNENDGAFPDIVNYAVAGKPLYICTADLDGDLDLDLAVATATADSFVSVLKNKGDGSFEPAVNYKAGPYPWSICAQDFDKDGRLDLAVANCDPWNPNPPYTVSILMNSGNGTFAPAVNRVVGNYPSSVCAGDFDGDGKNDLAVTNLGDHNVSILKGNGDGTFAAADNYGTHTSPFYIAAADLDENGKLDLAVANYSSGDVSILINISPSPVLAWSSDKGYDNVDGINPNLGAPNQLFEFRVVYKNENGDPPGIGFPVLSLDADGDGLVNGPYDHELAMLPAGLDADFVNGKQYFIQANLEAPPAGRYRYRFSANDITGATATGAPTNWTDDLRVGEFPDPAIYASDIQMSSPYALPNDSFIVAVTVRNNSDYAAENVPVSVRREPNGSSIKETTVTHIAPWGSEVISFKCAIADEGFYLLHVFVDKSNRITELVETNNDATRPVIIGRSTPGRMVITGIPTQISVASLSRINIIGCGRYYGTIYPAPPPVQGATVTIRPQWEAEDIKTYSNDGGLFSQSFTVPYVISATDYSLSIHMTDYTLKADTSITIRVSPLPAPIYRPDLSISVSPSSVCEGESSEISWYVRNDGSLPSQATHAILEYDGLGSPDTVAVPALQPHEQYNCPSRPTNILLRSGSSVIGRVDAENQIAELNKYNNLAIKYIDVFPVCYELSPEGLAVSDWIPEVDQSVSMTLLIRNGGCLVTPATRVLFRINGSRVDSLEIGPIQGNNGYAPAVFTQTFESAGSYRLDFIVDPHNVAPSECDETNDTLTTYIAVIDSPPGNRPDLVVHSQGEGIMLSNCCPAPGDALTWVKGKVINNGSETASNVYVRLSIDNVPIHSDTLLGDIAPGDTAAVDCDVDWIAPPIPPGMYYVFSLCADPDSIIEETDEFNNCATMGMGAYSTAIANLAACSSGEGIMLEWSALGAFAGCAIERSGFETTAWTLLGSCSPVRSGNAGYNEYRYIDAGAEIGKRYDYRILGVKPSGERVELGIVSALYAGPPELKLYSNYPNPFNPLTTIRFDLPEKANVKLSVYDVSGRLVRVLAAAPMAAGRKEISWDGRDGAGRPVVSGLYFYSLEAGKFTETRKMVLLR